LRSAPTPRARRVAAQAADERPACTIFSYQTVLGCAVAPNTGAANGGQYSHTTADGTVVLTPFTTAVNRLQTALDVAGVFDPTPISDGVNALIYAGRGQGLDALIAVAGIVPYVGDLAKGGKYGAKAFKAGNKVANKQVNAVAQEFGISGVARKEFGKFIEKNKGLDHRGGADNYTYEQLRDLAQEFIEHRPKG